MTPPIAVAGKVVSIPSSAEGQALSRVKTGVPPGGEKQVPPASQVASGDKYLEALGGLPTDRGDAATALNQSSKNFCPSCQQAAELGGQEAMAKTMSQLETLNKQVQQEEVVIPKFEFSSQDQAESGARQINSGFRQESSKGSGNNASPILRRGQEQVPMRDSQLTQRQNSVSARSESSNPPGNKSTQEASAETRRNSAEGEPRGEGKNLISNSKLTSGGFADRLSLIGLLSKQSFSQATFSSVGIGERSLSFDSLKFSFLSFLRSSEGRDSKTMNSHDVFYRLSKEVGSFSARQMLPDASVKNGLVNGAQPHAVAARNIPTLLVNNKASGGMFANFIKNLFNLKLSFRPLPQKALVKNQDGTFLPYPMTNLVTSLRTSGKDPKVTLSWLESWIKKILPGQVSISVAEMSEAEVIFWMALWKKIRKKKKSSSLEDDFEDLEEILAELSQSHFIPSLLRQEILGKYS